MEGVDGESRPFEVVGSGLDHSLLELLGLGLITGLKMFDVAALTSSQVGSEFRFIYVIPYVQSATYMPASEETGTHLFFGAEALLPQRQGVDNLPLLVLTWINGIDWQQAEGRYAGKNCSRSDNILQQGV